MILFILQESSHCEMGKNHWGFLKSVKPIQFEILMRIVFVVFSRFRAMFVHFIPCVSLVILNFLLFRAMKEAENKREKLLNSNPKVNFNRRETKESKKIRDANTTTLMLIVVISVSTEYKSEITYSWVGTNMVFWTTL